MYYVWEYLYIMCDVWEYVWHLCMIFDVYVGVGVYDVKVSVMCVWVSV